MLFEDGTNNLDITIRRRFSVERSVLYVFARFVQTAGRREVTACDELMFHRLADTYERKYFARPMQANRRVDGVLPFRERGFFFFGHAGTPSCGENKVVSGIAS